MELGLSLGEAPPPAKACNNGGVEINALMLGLGFSMDPDQARVKQEEEREKGGNDRRSPDSPTPPLQLDLLPLAPVLRTTSAGQGSQRAFVLSPQLDLQWSHEHAISDRSSSGAAAAAPGPVQLDLPDRTSQPAVSSSPPTSTTAPSFHLHFSTLPETASGDRAAERITTSRASDEDDNSGGARKKLRLSKEQSAFLEESFKEHSTLNPKQKLGLAKQLNLRPRQVEVWFQNRRARTKLKQTEVDCDNLKRCCERLTEENRRLQRELQELRAFKATAAAHPFYTGHLPATTLSMCPSCDRIAAAAANASPSPSPLTATGNSHQRPHSPLPVGLSSSCRASAEASHKT